MKVDYRYAGVIGSSRKMGVLLDQLAADGYPAERYGPSGSIGLEIEAAETRGGDRGSHRR